MPRATVPGSTRCAPCTHSSAGTSIAGVIRRATRSAQGPAALTSTLAWDSIRRSVLHIAQRHPRLIRLADRIAPGSAAARPAAAPTAARRA